MKWWSSPIRLQSVRPPRVASLLLTWGSKARGKTPPGEEPPWSARNYVPYWSQIISKEVQRGAAREIVDRVREDQCSRAGQGPRLLSRGR